MQIVVLSDDRDHGERLAEAIRSSGHNVWQTAVSTADIDFVPEGVPLAFLLAHRSPIALRLGVARVRQKHGDRHPILVVVQRNDASELPHVLAAGVDDFVVWPRDPEFLGTRLALIQHRVFGILLDEGQIKAQIDLPELPAREPQPDADGVAESRRVADTLQILLKVVPDPVLWLTQDGAVQDFHANRSLAGHKPWSMMVGKALDRVFPADVAAAFQHAIDDTLDGVEDRVVYYTLDKDGETHPFRAVMGRAGHDEVVVVLSERDATAASERTNKDPTPSSDGPNATENALSGDFLRRIFEAFPLHVYVYSLETGQLQFTNRPTDTVSGVTLADRSERGQLFDLVHPEDVALLDARNQQWPHTADGTVVARQFRSQRDDGGWRWLETREVVFRRDVDGNPVEILGMATDVSDRREAAAKVRVSEERLRVALSGRDDIVYEWDVETNAVHYFGTPPDLLSWLPNTRALWEGRIHDDDQAAVGLKTRLELENGTGFSQTYRVRWKDEGWRHCLDRAAIVRDASGKPIRWIGIYTDISDRMEAQTRAGRDQKMEAVAHLAGGVAEDFNRMLVSLFASLDDALAETPEGQVRVDLIQGRHTAEKALDLTRQLLGFGRRQSIQPEYISLNDVIGDAIDELSRRAGSHIALSFESSEHLGTVLADPLQMEQVLHTLCLRARDTMPDGGTLSIATSNVKIQNEFARMPARARPGRYVRLRVEDTGSGIPEALLNHVFDPFYESPQGNERTGLGLAMVAGIIDQHEGVIVAENHAPHGSLFSIYLPVVERPPARMRRPMEPARGGDETILLTDDDELVRNMAARILRGAGYTVLPARDGIEALQIYENQGHFIDLVILDLMMPRMGGRAAHAAMAEIDPDAHFLFVSGYTMSAQDTDFVQDRRRRFLAKPFNTGQLLREIRKALDG
ncbi:MAG: PAS domain S-box-containing protein [Myxococcota bacterium]|jgi:PAS domain S-box-containing protein